MQRITSCGASIAYVSSFGCTLDKAPLHFFWGHGWGQDHRIFLGLAHALERYGIQINFDFPGFGESPHPPADWGTADYADAFAHWIATLPPARRIWIGHSFGCRVGLQLAARHPSLIDGLFLIAAAGLPRSRTPFQRLKIRTKIAAFKAFKVLPRLGFDTASLAAKFGSADYRGAGSMRSILVKVVREDLTETARQVKCPVQLVYGALDDQTPPEIGHRLLALMPNASISILPRFDHYTILTAGNHQVQHQIERFIKRIEA